MTITFYNTSSSPNTLVKSLSGGTQKQGVVRGEMNVVRPVIDVTGDITGVNYAYISDFGRYYYVEEMKVVREGITRITLKSDPLMSFANEIKNLPVIAIRSSENTKQSAYIIDGEQKYQAFHKIQTLHVADLPMSSLFVLVTAG